MGAQVPVAIIPTRWGSQPYPPHGYATRWSRNMGLWRGYPESDGGFKIHRIVAAAITEKPGGSYVHSHTDGTRTIIYYNNDALYYETGSGATSIKTGLTATYCPGWANMGSPLGMSLFVNGTDAPTGIRIESSNPNDFLANFEKPNANWSATASAAGGTLPNATYYIRIAQVEVDTTMGTTVSAPSAVKSVTLTGGNTRIVVAQGTWTANARATAWRVGISNTTDTPSAYFWSGSDTAIATTPVNIDSMPTSTQPFESRNGFYKTTDLTEIIGSKHPIGVVVHMGRWVVWYANDNRILWSERDEWGWYSTNSLDTGAEGGWNLPVLCLVPYNAALLAFTADAIHGVFGDFSRDLDGANPTYAAQASARPLVTGTGLAGGTEAAKNIDGSVWFLSTRGPAVLSGGRVLLLAPEDIRHERAHWDTAYLDHALVCDDPRTGDILFGVPRKTNSSRPMDGASVAGIVDAIYRWIPSRNVWDIPIQLDVVHLASRTNGAKAAIHKDGPVLMAMGPHGGVVSRLDQGHAGGVLDVSSTDYDGKLGSANATTTVTIAYAGLAANDLVGRTITLRYPSGDSTYPYVTFQKTIKSNTATSGGNTVITWSGAVTIPSTSFWTARACGIKRTLRVSVDPQAVGVGGPDSFAVLHAIEARFKDKVGAEAIS